MRFRPSIVITALAALTASLILAAPVGASSGGVTIASGGTGGTGGGTSTSEPPTGENPVVSAPRYERLWDRVSLRDKRWAHQTSECESGGDPKAIGGGGTYRGAFQFMRSTWKVAPKSPGGDPIVYSYRTQAVVAVALMHADGAGHWPNCG